MITAVLRCLPLLRRGKLTALIALCTALLLMLSAPTAPAQRPTAKITNPASGSFADTFADPSIIHAKDGWWYAYSTADPLKQGDELGVMHIARTRDFDTWDYLGTVFDDKNRPSWATADANLWAPDIRYLAGRYVLYFTVTDTTLNPGDEDSAIGVATSPTPVGPWVPTDAPVVAPRPKGDSYLWTIDPAGFTDVHGQHYLYFGSYFGGLWVTRMSNDGLTPTGPATQVAIDNRYEGSYVVRHGNWYYLMGSAANCCAGPTTGYSVFAGRSKSPLGPFIDADGISLLASKVGGTVLLTQNGNRWIGAGHHAIATDNAGRDFVVYHAIDRNKPWLAEPYGINRRPMLIDRIDWIDGWPKVRAGAGPSDSPQPAPVTGSSYGIAASNPAAAGFAGLSAGPVDPQSGRTGHVTGTARTLVNVPAKPLHLRLDLRGTRPLVVRLGDHSKKIRVTVDPRQSRLVVTTTSRGSSKKTVTAIGSNNGWRTLTVDVKGARLVVQLSESDLGDPQTQVRQHVPGFSLGRAPLRLRSENALVDNLSLRPLAKEAHRAVAVPKAGRLVIAEKFNTPLSTNWSWVRKDDAATVCGGGLSWPLESGDLNDDNNLAGVLLRDTPKGNWIAQTKVHLDLGIDQERNYQQAGLVAYDNDHNFARLTSVAIWNTRQTEFGRKLVATETGDTSYGGANIGTPAATVWLRLAHTRNPAGEHLYRAATSRDGKHWTWGAVWTFAATAHPRIGLVAHGGNSRAATAEFSYLRFYRTR